MSNSDPFEPINEGFKAIRDVYTNRRKLDIEEGKTNAELADKKEKKRKEKEKEDAKDYYLKLIRENPDQFTNADLAEASVRAGGGVGPYVIPKDKPILYPGQSSSSYRPDTSAAMQPDQATGEPTPVSGPDAASEDVGTSIRKNLEASAYDRGASLKNLKNVQARLLQDAGQPSAALMEGKATSNEMKAGLDAQQKGAAGLVLLNQKAISTIETQNKNFQDALKVFNGDEGQAALQTYYKKFDKEIKPLLLAHGADESAIDTKRQDFITGAADDWRLSKDAVAALYSGINKMAKAQSGVEEKALEQPETKQLLYMLGDASLDTMKKMLTNADAAGLDAYQKNLIMNAIRTKYFQDSASDFLMKTTGEAANFFPISKEQVDNIFSPIVKGAEDFIRSIPATQSQASTLRQYGSDVQKQEEEKKRKEAEKLRRGVRPQVTIDNLNLPPPQ